MGYKKKVTLREKFLVITSYSKKQERSQINNLPLCYKKLGNVKGLSNHKGSRKKKMRKK